MKKLCLTIGPAASVTTTAALAQQQQFINSLTGGQSDVHYPISGALSPTICAKAIPNARATAQVTQASAENLNLLQAGRGELSMTLGNAVSDA